MTNLRSNQAKFAKKFSSARKKALSQCTKTIIRNFLLVFRRNDFHFILNNIGGKTIVFVNTNKVQQMRRDSKTHHMQLWRQAAADFQAFDPNAKKLKIFHRGIGKGRRFERKKIPSYGSK